MIIHNKSDLEEITKERREEIKNHTAKEVFAFSSIGQNELDPIIDGMKKTMPETVFRKKSLLSRVIEKNDHVLLVTSPEELRIERIIKRDSTSESKVLQRMKYQMPESEKENLSDFVLKNDSGIEELEDKSKFFLMLFETMAK